MAMDRAGDPVLDDNCRGRGQGRYPPLCREPWAPVRLQSGQLLPTAGVGGTIGRHELRSLALDWMGGDPLAAIRALGAENIYHVHGKDTRVEPEARVNGTLDT